MKFTITSLCALTSVLSISTAFAQPLQKRNGVTLTAYYDNQIVVGSGGPGQGPSYQMRTWFGISIDGGQEKTFNGNSISGRWEVLPSSETGTPMDISFIADFNVGSYNGCKASYNGQAHAGTPMAGDGHDLGEVSAKCVMKFGL